MPLINRATRMLLMAFLMFTLLTVALNAFESAEAQAAFDFSVTLNGYSLSVAPNHEGYVQVTVSLVSGLPQNVTLTAGVSPQDGEVSGSFAQPSGNPPFLTTLIVSVMAAPPGKTYTITVTGAAQGLTRQAPPLAVIISCPQVSCPKPHVDWTDKTSYFQGESIQFKGSGFYTGDATASCLTTNNNATSVCQNQPAANAQGDVTGSMQVTSKISTGPQQFYLEDLTNDQQSAKVALTILQTPPLLTTTFSGQGSVSPNCPSGCPESVGQTLNVTATPAAGWTFSGWNMTGAGCMGGLNSNPCVFTMPNNPVSANAYYVQYQTLTTSYTGQGAISPSCASGCQVSVGSTILITATPAAGWVISGYRLTIGISCAPQIGYTCAFTMPSYPVSFQVTFAETTTTTKTTVTSTYSATTSVTSISSIESTVTSTTTTVAQSTIQVSGTQTTTVVYSTVSTTNTQTQNYATTQFLTLTTTAASTVMSVPHPLLELGLAAIILISSLIIGVNVVKRSPRHGIVTCANCGFQNSTPGKYCVGCGEPLKRP
jgi:hypothetical protein